jgi:hypothetical protein
MQAQMALLLEELHNQHQAAMQAAQPEPESSTAHACAPAPPMHAQQPSAAAPMQAGPRAAPRQQPQQQPQQQQQQQQRPASWRAAAAAGAAQQAALPAAAQSAAPKAAAQKASQAAAPQWQAARGTRGIKHFYGVLRQFTLQTPRGAVTGPLEDLAATLTSLMQQLMPKAQFTIVHCQPCSSRQLQPSGDFVDRYFVEVATAKDAASLVDHRCLLKGTGYSLLEVLTKDEQVDHALLWPRFKKAKAQQGVKAQFDRARLYSDGVEILPSTVLAARA